MGWYFSKVVEKPGVVDYEVSSLTSDPVGRAAAGAAGRTAPARGEPVAAWRSRVVLKRRGEVTLPVHVLLQYEDGRRERMDWDGQDRWKAITREGPSRIASVGP